MGTLAGSFYDAIVSDRVLLQWPANLFMYGICEVREDEGWCSGLVTLRYTDHTERVLRACTCLACKP